MDLWEVLEYVGETLVFLGVVGEVFAEWREPHRTKLSKASQIVLVIGLALSLAALIATNETFNGKIADLNVQAGEFNANAAASELDAANARKETEQLRKDEQALKTRANEAELETAKLKAKMAPRTVTAAQAKILCRLVHVDGNRSMEISSSVGTVEPDDFAQDIGKAIVNCQRGLSVLYHGPALISPTPTPFTIGYAPTRKADAQMLSDAMVKAHIAAKAIDLLPIPDADKYPNALRLFVGPKLP